MPSTAQHSLQHFEREGKQPQQFKNFGSSVVRNGMLELEPVGNHI